MPIEININLRAETSAEMAEQLRTLASVIPGQLTPVEIAGQKPAEGRTTKDIAGTSVSVPLASVASVVDTANGTANDDGAGAPPKRSRGRPRKDGSQPASEEQSAGPQAAAPQEELPLTTTEEVAAAPSVEEDTAQQVRTMVDRITAIFKKSDTAKRDRIVAWREKAGLALVRDLKPEHLPAAQELLAELEDVQ